MLVCFCVPCCNKFLLSCILWYSLLCTLSSYCWLKSVALLILTSLATRVLHRSHLPLAPSFSNGRNFETPAYTWLLTFCQKHPGRKRMPQPKDYENWWNLQFCFLFQRLVFFSCFVCCCLVWLVCLFAFFFHRDWFFVIFCRFCYYILFTCFPFILVCFLFSFIQHFPCSAFLIRLSST